MPPIHPQAGARSAQRTGCIWRDVVLTSSAGAPGYIAVLHWLDCREAGLFPSCHVYLNAQLRG